MCGIAGSINYSNLSVLKKVLSKIEHRGPDDTGYFVHKNFMFGTCRLSILDIKYGKQPMYSEDKKIVLSFNGEIFNYVEIKKDLLDNSFGSQKNRKVSK